MRGRINFSSPYIPLQGSRNYEYCTYSYLLSIHSLAYYSRQFLLFTANFSQALPVVSILPAVKCHVIVFCLAKIIIYRHYEYLAPVWIFSANLSHVLTLPYYWSILRTDLKNLKYIQQQWTLRTKYVLIKFDTIESISDTNGVYIYDACNTK